MHTSLSTVRRRRIPLISYNSIPSLLVQSKCLKSQPKPEANVLLIPHKSLQFSLFCFLDVSRINPRILSCSTARPFTITPFVNHIQSRRGARNLHLEPGANDLSQLHLAPPICTSKQNAVSSINTLDAIRHEVSKEKRRGKGMGRKKAIERYLDGSFGRLSKPLSKPSICLWLSSGRKCLTNMSSDSETDRTAAAIDFDDDVDEEEEDICRAYYISKPTDISPRLTWPPPHVIRASERFFVPPTAASSLVEEARVSAASSSTSQSDMVSVDSTAVITFSKDPYHDFLKSMKEMMEAHNAVGADDRLDWEFMEQLLLCYLELNERSVHKDILRAFTDLTAAFRRMSP
ncbi:hypothetical protein GW17_00004954 [Ensete ventricosum]|uniref:Transcription repressor n=2 Tax=Ensete ventricosum TaxID=4639 RepID=A0A427BBW5_ENSVE|nr:hypothetical protein B296_00002861 [Ensete ventricosum]RWW30470.1 hypothetical protein GW17_00004954 [Ensete ventricosum]RZR79911.1 hypothetical protein BHM03_00005770 [Ensete ventricosum]